MNDAEVHTGRCLCGAVQFEARGKAKWSAHCHCESCRRHTSSVMATFAGYPEDRFRYTRGEPKVYESSPERWRSFCGNCGSPLTYQASWDPGMVHVYVGAFDKPQDFPAQFQVFCAERIGWFDTADELPRYKGISSKGELM